MVSKIIRLLSCLIILTVFVQCQWAEPPLPLGRRLRDIVAEKYPDGDVLIGGTTGSWCFISKSTNQSIVMDREFSYVTPENDFKQHTIHPSPEVWNWSDADAWKQHIIDNSQILRMHCPIGPQCSIWAKDDSRTSAELETNLREFLQAVCERYNDQPGYEYMDVVNETIVSGNWHENKNGIAWECPWFIIGQDTDPHQTPLYIKIAFEIAKKYAPNLKFIFNHHEEPAEEDSWLKITQTVHYLREGGLRVDGIGWQAHVDAGWDTSENLNKLRSLIDWTHNNDLEFHITELSVWLKNGYSASELQKQAQTYRNILSAMLEKRSNGELAWNTWHISDARGWHTGWFPSLFDWNYKAKPAYYALQDILENPP